MEHRVGCDTLYALVPALDGHDRRKARQFHFRRQAGQDRARIHRQQSAQGRGGRVQLSFRRHKGDVRGARLHRVGLLFPGVHQEVEGRLGGAVHPDGVLFLYGRGARQKDAVAQIHGCGQPSGREAAQHLGRGRAQGHRQRRRRAGVLPRRQERL